MMVKADDISGAMGMLVVALIIWLSFFDGCDKIQCWTVGREGMFGERLSVDAAKQNWTGEKTFDAEQGFIRKIHPSKPSEFFDEYYHYVMPNSRRVYALSGVCRFPILQDFNYKYDRGELEAMHRAEMRFAAINEVLKGKYRQDSITEMEAKYHAEGREIVLSINKQEGLARCVVLECKVLDIRLKKKLAADIREYQESSL